MASMRIIIETIDHELQRYPTCGDWIALRKGQKINGVAVDEGVHEIGVRVSEVGDWRMEALVGIHELVEAVLCIDKGISQESVDEFDIAFEKARSLAENNVAADTIAYAGYGVNIDSEPGDHPAAPYHIQHGYATAVERMLCAAMNIPWATYESRLKELDG